MKINMSSFFEAVRKMRSAQRTYFQTRGYDALAEAKKWEKEVDKMIQEHNQTDLFSGHDGI